MTNSIEVEHTVTHDIYKGNSAALLAAGVVEPKHLEPQPGRRKGWRLFMPDGSAVPEGLISPTYLPGHMSVRISGDGHCIVRRAVDADVRRLREEAEPTLFSQYAGRKHYRGSRERLIRDGIPERWLLDPRNGKKRGRREFYEGDQKIEVSFSEKRINVDVTHIDYYRSWGKESYLRYRQEFGLPLVVRKHLSLVWSSDWASA